VKKQTMSLPLRVGLSGSLLVACLILLIGCETLKVEATNECDWFVDQSFAQDTKDWLLRHLDDAPASAEGDLKNVADNSEKYRLFCRPGQ